MIAKKLKELKILNDLGKEIGGDNFYVPSVDEVRGRQKYVRNKYVIRTSFPFMKSVLIAEKFFDNKFHCGRGTTVKEDIELDQEIDINKYN